MGRPYKFYIVFSPDGPTPPVKVHRTHGEAHSAAWLMAARFPGQSFFVMQRAGKEAVCDTDGSPQGPDPKGLDGEAATAGAEGIARMQYPHP